MNYWIKRSLVALFAGLFTTILIFVATGYTKAIPLFWLLIIFYTAIFSLAYLSLYLLIKNLIFNIKGNKVYSILDIVGIGLQLITVAIFTIRVESIILISYSIICLLLLFYGIKIYKKSKRELGLSLILWSIAIIVYLIMPVIFSLIAYFFNIL